LIPYFEAGSVSIYHGDAREIVPTLEKVGLVVTDPPYKPGGGRREWQATASVAVGLDATARQLRKDGAMLVFTTTSGRGIDFTLGAVGNQVRFNRLLVWHKRFVRSQVAGPWRWDAVSILAFGRASFGRPMFSSVYTSDGPSSADNCGNNRHPAELPSGIADWLYAPFAGGIGAVLDPFCGSGVLLIPAAREGRRVIGVDIDERWCEESARRLSNLQLKLEAA
jgi:site-specific DNA-methyltransferase (adenine-specific)